MEPEVDRGTKLDHLFYRLQEDIEVGRWYQRRQNQLPGKSLGDS